MDRAVAVAADTQGGADRKAGSKIGATLHRLFSLE